MLFEILGLLFASPVGHLIKSECDSFSLMLHRVVVTDFPSTIILGSGERFDSVRLTVGDGVQGGHYTVVKRRGNLWVNVLVV